MYIVKGWGVMSTVSGEGKSSVQCEGKGNKVYIVKGREIKCTVAREGNVWWGDREGRKEGRDKGGLREGLDRRGESN